MVYLADQFTKMWALSNLRPGVRQPWLGELLQLHLIFNPGAAFSIGAGFTWVFTLVQAIVPAVILWFSPRLRAWPWAVGAGLAVGGALGNLTDRLIRDPGFGVGHVVDFLELPHWPIFNVADSAIVAAAGVVAVATLLGIGAFGDEVATDEKAEASVPNGGGDSCRGDDVARADKDSRRAEHD